MPIPPSSSTRYDRPWQQQRTNDGGYVWTNDRNRIRIIQPGYQNSYSDPFSNTLSPPPKPINMGQQPQDGNGLSPYERQQLEKYRQEVLQRARDQFGGGLTDKYNLDLNSNMPEPGRQFVNRYGSRGHSTVGRSNLTQVRSLAAASSQANTSDNFFLDFALPSIASTTWQMPQLKSTPLPYFWPHLEPRQLAPPQSSFSSFTFNPHMTAAKQPPLIRTQLPLGSAPSSGLSSMQFAALPDIELLPFVTSTQSMSGATLSDVHQPGQTLSVPTTSLIPAAEQGLDLARGLSHTPSATDAVPEPSTVALLIIGMVTLFLQPIRT
jgi:hypothetical protein